ncbi:hypothetical protein ACOSP7_004099 [Xanthoceras sorbifolium]|uniref:PB1 domain-containing protein n=1 Tax=Xanthoceras sorbifolium TaxID=99658 RepID=A0ABQ8IH48_9ROSI|nr:hypothetical protein JRO89_XS02G0249700 [Xanthoceras sorbifolium]
MTSDTGVGGGGDETSSSVSSSPRNRVKFLCSHGGKILPRAVDGNLKYVGGETRVVAFPRDIILSELMKKLTTTTMSDGDMVLKYQLIPEDLDSLVSVRTDEDLKHMFDEYDRHESEGTPKLRAFLFPSNPVVIENQTGPVDPQAIEQRYIDAINGIVRTTANGRLTPVNAGRASFSISSACSSPKSTSPESITVETTPHEFILVDGYQKGRVTMHKVKSSPSLCSLSNHHHQSSSSPSSHHIYQHPGHHYYQNHQQQLHPHSYQTNRPPPVTLGQPDFVRAPFAHGPMGYARSHSSRSHYANGSYNKYGYYEESAYGLRRADRTESLPHSLPHSPRKGNMQEGRGSGYNMEVMN